MSVRPSRKQLGQIVQAPLTAVADVIVSVGTDLPNDLIH
jgi:hypothetical protein